MNRVSVARAEALVGRNPAESTRAETWAASPRAVHGAWREWARRRVSGESAMGEDYGGLDPVR